MLNSPKINLLQRNYGDAGLWILVDPDRFEPKVWDSYLPQMPEGVLAGFLVGGSLQTTPEFESTVAWLKASRQGPVVLFPGSILQISPTADALLLLSLISGRNPEFLIGQHVQAAAALQASGLELIPTGYILIDGGKTTTAHYITQTIPIPPDKPEVAAVTALAGQQLGLKLIYLDCGSGAAHHVPIRMVHAVRQAVDLPIVVGGGIRTVAQAKNLRAAGADWVVMGSVFEQHPEEILKELGAMSLA